MTYARDREFQPGLSNYTDIFKSHTWNVPERFNIAQDVCDRHATTSRTADRVALHYVDVQGREQRYTFAQIKALSDRFANVLTAQGLSRGDRVAILLPQRPETAVAHMAVYKAGLVAVPMTVLFRRQALQYRLENSGARAIVCGAESLELVQAVQADAPALECIFVVDPPGRPAPAHVLDFHDLVQAAPSGFRPVDTAAEDAAMIVYTSGTTGNPKGALHAHRSLIGHFTGIELSQNFMPREGACYWAPADWAWVGGLLNVLLSGWHYAVPVLAYAAPGAFNPEKALHMMQQYRVTNALIPPTALKMMREVPDIRGRYNLNLYGLVSGGEALGEATLTWAQQELGIMVNEAYGQTEANYFLGNSHTVWPVKPGSMGRAFPGHRVTVVDGESRPLGPGRLGEIALHRSGDPLILKEYWNHPQATRDKFAGNWLLTGDLAEMDEEGYFWFKSRNDDVIITAGHRIGPVEIENALLAHPAVVLAAVVASPDKLRNDIVKGFIKAAPGYTPSPELAREIQDFVKANLAVHEYPREIEFIDEFPLTTTGKIIRGELRKREQARKGMAP